MGRYFGTDGIRGVAGELLTPDLAVRVGRAAATVLAAHRGPGPLFVLGRDTRLSGPMLEAALVAGITSGGGHVQLAGVIPTPGLAALVLQQGADAGVVVIAALISPYRLDRAMAAERAKEKGIPFAEIYINAPLAECERRDPKQLYRKARAGQILQFTGIDSPYEAPLAPDLELRTDRESVGDSIEKLTQAALSLARPQEQALDGAGADI